MKCNGCSIPNAEINSVKTTGSERIDLCGECIERVKIMIQNILAITHSDNLCVRSFIVDFMTTQTNV